MAAEKKLFVSIISGKVTSKSATSLTCTGEMFAELYKYLQIIVCLPILRKQNKVNALVAGLCAFHGIGSKDDLNAARDAAPWKLGLHLLDPNFLEVDEAGLVDVQHEPRPVAALQGR